MGWQLGFLPLCAEAKLQSALANTDKATELKILRAKRRRTIGQLISVSYVS
jgi:hypothetical protein